MGNFRKKKKKIKEPPHWPGGAPPLSPKAEAFLPFRVWLETFLPASSKSNNKPLVPWEHRGGWAQGERCIRHAACTRGQPVGGENTQRNDREREWRVCIWKVFSAWRRGSSLCESNDEWNRKAKCKGVKKSAMSFIRLGGLGNVFKNFRPTSKKQLFPTNIKGPQPTARFRHKFCRDLLLIYTHGTK